VSPLAGRSLPRRPNTSNAIEGNTLSPIEAMLVIEKGITIGGRPLKDDLEAIDHFPGFAT
jgi:hypothetical protein